VIPRCLAPPGASHEAESDLDAAHGRAANRVATHAHFNNEGGDKHMAKKVAKKPAKKAGKKR
jgi:hypothetical protein